MLRAVLCLCICLITYSAAWSQTSQADSIASIKSIIANQENYQNAIAGNAKVFSGVEFVDPMAKKRTNGHANFMSEDWQQGFIVFNGQRYDNVDLQYNVFLNKVLIENVQSHATIELDNKRIDAFGISEHIFIKPATPVPGEPSESFFDLLYDDGIKVLVRRYKTIIETPEQKVMITQFLDKQKIYLFKDGQYISISNKKSALNAFAENKSEMKKFLSQQRINFRSNPELAMVAMSQHFNQLNGKH